MKKLIIFGVSGYAKHIWYYFSAQTDTEVIGFAIDIEYLKEREFCGLPVYTTEELINFMTFSDVYCFYAVGYRCMRSRMQKFDQLEEYGVRFTSYISPSAIVHTDLANIGPNTLILAQSVIEPFTTLGKNVIIWSNVTVCHDASIGCHSFIASGTVIGGYASLGKLCFLGFNSTIGSQIKLGDETLVGAASFVSKNTEARCFYAGTPAKKKYSIEKDGIRINE